ncbi:MAG: hypothetical protein KDC49_13900 [Saprospiraceae bacterium]|nr:hypothetical protein [Saprospiraceae bacterium]
MKFDIAYIEKYLDGQLDNQASLEFEQEMSSDPSLRQEVEDLRTLKSALETRALREKLEAIMEEPAVSAEQPKSNKGIGASRWILVALLLMATLALLYYVGKQLKTKEVPQMEYAAYFQKDPGLPTPMGAPAGEYTLMDAMVDYKAGNYEMSLLKLGQLQNYTDTITYYKALNLYEMGMKEIAIDSLKRIAPESGYANRSLWYQLKCYLDLGNYAQAKVLLKDIDPATEGFEEVSKWLNQQSN